MVGSDCGVRGLAHTTDPAKIAALVEAGDWDETTLIFSTYHSLERVAAALSVPDGTPRLIDLAIFDEAHVTAGRASKLFSFGLDDAVLPVQRRLFMTATPRYLARHAGQIEAHSMDDEAVYGPLVYRLPYQLAVDEGIIVPLKLCLPDVTERYEAHAV